VSVTGGVGDGPDLLRDQAGRDSVTALRDVERPLAPVELSIGVGAAVLAAPVAVST
jgi:hypothetical protein